MLDNKFLKNIQSFDDCWIWKPYKGRYPWYKPTGMKQIQAHRYVCTVYHGDMTGKVARHTCDNPACVNPKHIIPGTQQDNIADGVKRGRYKNNRIPEWARRENRKKS